MGKGLQSLCSARMARAAFLAMALIAILARLSAAAAPGCSPVVSTESQFEIAQEWTGDFTLALVAVLVSFIIATIIFMVGASFKNDKVRNFGIGEFYEAIATALIVGFFMFSVGILLNAVPQTLLLSTSSLPTSNSVVVASEVAAGNPYLSALGGINTTICNMEGVYDTALNGVSINFPWLGTSGHGYKDLAEALSATYTITLPLISPTNPIPLLSYGIAIDKLPDQVQYAVPIQTLASLITDLLYLLWGEYYLLLFFSFVAPVFMVAGIIFRAFLPTRSFGGMLIAIGMGFYIIMPILFSFVFAQCTPGSPGCLIPSPAGNPLSVVSSQINQYWLVILLYPILVMSVTYAFIVEIANFIGASAQMGGRLRAGFI